MADFGYRFEQSGDDPNMVTNISCLFEAGIHADKVHGFLEDLERAIRAHGVGTAIEEMRRTEANKLYVRIGFRALNEEEGGTEEWMGE